MNEGERFRFEVLHGLANYQLIELFLKDYLALHFELTRLILGNRLYFGFDAKEYERSSLQGLIPKFAKVCNNKQLLKDLNAAKDHRDHLAHRALRDYWADTSTYDFGQLLTELQPIDEQYRVIGDVAAEVRKLETLKAELAK